MARINSMFKAFEILLYNRNMLIQTTVNDIKAKYAGSFIGLSWAILYPVVFLAAYAMMYIFVFNAKFHLYNTNDYVVMIFCGLIPYLGFQESVAGGTTSVVANVNLLKNTLFPIELVPAKTVFASQATQISGMILIALATIWLGRASVFTLLCIPLWILQIMFTVGVVWILSSLNVIFRDLQNMVYIMLFILMMVSPIAYPVEEVPDNLRFFLQLNPLYYIIACYQDVFMHSRMPDAYNFSVFFIMSFVSFFGGYHFFSRMKRVFTDNV